MSASLPPEFRELEPFVSQWAVTGKAARHRRRLESTDAERRAFYDAMLPRIREMVSFIDQQPINQLTPERHSLLQLALSLIEASMTIEIYNAETEREHAKTASLIEVYCDSD
jgi:hypothetical protein